MEDSFAVLNYANSGFSTQAKKLLRNGKNFNISFKGMPARIISYSLPLLMHMQNNGSSNKEEFNTPYVLLCFCKLMLILNFVVVFWLAVSRKMHIRLESAQNGYVELAIRTQVEGNS